MYHNNSRFSNKRYPERRYYEERRAWERQVTEFEDAPYRREREHIVTRQIDPIFAGNSHLIREREPILPDDSHLIEERDQHFAYDSHLVRERNQHLAYDSHLVRERDAIFPDDSHLVRERDHSFADNSRLIRERDQSFAYDFHLVRERDAIFPDDSLVRERDQISSSDSHLGRERDYVREGDLGRYQQDYLGNDNDVYREGNKYFPGPNQRPTPRMSFYPYPGRALPPSSVLRSTPRQRPFTRNYPPRRRHHLDDIFLPNHDDQDTADHEEEFHHRTERPPVRIEIATTRPTTITSQTQRQINDTKVASEKVRVLKYIERTVVVDSSVKSTDKLEVSKESDMVECIQTKVANKTYSDKKDAIASESKSYKSKSVVPSVNGKKITKTKNENVLTYELNLATSKEPQRSNETKINQDKQSLKHGTNLAINKEPQKSYGIKANQDKSSSIHERNLASNKEPQKTHAAKTNEDIYSLVNKGVQPLSKEVNAIQQRTTVKQNKGQTRLDNKFQERNGAEKKCCSIVRKNAPERKITATNNTPKVVHESVLEKSSKVARNDIAEKKIETNTESDIVEELEALVSKHDDNVLAEKSILNEQESKGNNGAPTYIPSNPHEREVIINLTRTPLPQSIVNLNDESGKSISILEETPNIIDLTSPPRKEDLGCSKLKTVRDREINKIKSKDVEMIEEECETIEVVEKSDDSHLGSTSFNDGSKRKSGSPRNIDVGGTLRLDQDFANLDTRGSFLWTFHQRFDDNRVVDMDISVSPSSAHSPEETRRSEQQKETDRIIKAMDDMWIEISGSNVDGKCASSKKVKGNNAVNETRTNNEPQTRNKTEANQDKFISIRKGIVTIELDGNETQEKTTKDNCQSKLKENQVKKNETPTNTGNSSIHTPDPGTNNEPQKKKATKTKQDKHSLIYKEIRTDINTIEEKSTKDNCQSKLKENQAKKNETQTNTGNSSVHTPNPGTINEPQKKKETMTKQDQHSLIHKGVGTDVNTIQEKPPKDNCQSKLQENQAQKDETHTNIGNSSIHTPHPGTNNEPQQKKETKTKQDKDIGTDVNTLEENSTKDNCQSKIKESQVKKNETPTNTGNSLLHTSNPRGNNEIQKKKETKIRLDKHSLIHKEIRIDVNTIQEKSTKDNCQSKLKENQTKTNETQTNTGNSSVYTPNPGTNNKPQKKKGTKTKQDQHSLIHKDVETDVNTIQEKPPKDNCQSELQENQAQKDETHTNTGNSSIHKPHPGTNNKPQQKKETKTKQDEDSLIHKGIGTDVNAIQEKTNKVKCQNKSKDKDKDGKNVKISRLSNDLRSFALKIQQNTMTLTQQDLKVSVQDRLSKQLSVNKNVAIVVDNTVKPILTDNVDYNVEPSKRSTCNKPGYRPRSASFIYADYTNNVKTLLRKTKSLNNISSKVTVDFRSQTKGKSIEIASLADVIKPLYVDDRDKSTLLFCSLESSDQFSSELMCSNKESAVMIDCGISKKSLPDKLVIDAPDDPGQKKRDDVKVTRKRKIGRIESSDDEECAEDSLQISKKDSNDQTKQKKQKLNDKASRKRKMPLDEKKINKELTGAPKTSAANEESQVQTPLKYVTKAEYVKSFAKEQSIVRNISLSIERIPKKQQIKQRRSTFTCEADNETILKKVDSGEGCRKKFLDLFGSISEDEEDLIQVPTAKICKVSEKQTGKNDKKRKSCCKPLIEETTTSDSSQANEHPTLKQSKKIKICGDRQGKSKKLKKEKIQLGRTKTGESKDTNLSLTVNAEAGIADSKLKIRKSKGKQNCIGSNQNPYLGERRESTSSRADSTSRDSIYQECTEGKTPKKNIRMSRSRSKESDASMISDIEKCGSKNTSKERSLSKESSHSLKSEQRKSLQHEKNFSDYTRDSTSAIKSYKSGCIYNKNALKKIKHKPTDKKNDASSQNFENVKNTNSKEGVQSKTQSKIKITTEHNPGMRNQNKQVNTKTSNKRKSHLTETSNSANKEEGTKIVHQQKLKPKSKCIKVAPIHKLQTPYRRNSAPNMLSSSSETSLILGEIKDLPLLYRASEDEVCVEFKICDTYTPCVIKYDRITKLTVVEAECIDRVYISAPREIQTDTKKMKQTPKEDDDVIEIRPIIPVIDLTETEELVKSNLEISPKKTFDDLLLETKKEIEEIPEEQATITLYRSEEGCGNLDEEVQAVAASIPSVIRERNFPQIKKDEDLIQQDAAKSSKAQVSSNNVDVDDGTKQQDAAIAISSEACSQVSSNIADMDDNTKQQDAVIAISSEACTQVSSSNVVFDDHTKQQDAALAMLSEASAQVSSNNVDVDDNTKQPEAVEKASSAASHLFSSLIQNLEIEHEDNTTLQPKTTNIESPQLPAAQEVPSSLEDENRLAVSSILDIRQNNLCSNTSSFDNIPNNVCEDLPLGVTSQNVNADKCNVDEAKRSQQSDVRSNIRNPGQTNQMEENSASERPTHADCQSTRNEQRCLKHDLSNDGTGSSIRPRVIVRPTRAEKSAEIDSRNSGSRSAPAPNQNVQEFGQHNGLQSRSTVPIQRQVMPVEGQHRGLPQTLREYRPVHRGNTTSTVEPPALICINRNRNDHIQQTEQANSRTTQNAAVENNQISSQGCGSSGNFRSFIDLTNDNGELSTMDKKLIIEIFTRHTFFLAHLFQAQNGYIQYLTQIPYCQHYFRAECALFEEQKYARLSSQSLRLVMELQKLNIRATQNLAHSASTIVEQITLNLLDKEMPKPVTKSMVYLLLAQLIKPHCELFAKVPLLKALTRLCNTILTKLFSKIDTPSSMSEMQRIILFRQVEEYRRMFGEPLPQNQPNANINGPLTADIQPRTYIEHPRQHNQSLVTNQLSNQGSRNIAPTTDGFGQKIPVITNQQPISNPSSSPLVRLEEQFELLQQSHLNSSSGSSTGSRTLQRGPPNVSIGPNNSIPIPTVMYRPSVGPNVMNPPNCNVPIRQHRFASPTQLSGYRGSPNRASLPKSSVRFTRELPGGANTTTLGYTPRYIANYETSNPSHVYVSLGRSRQQPSTQNLESISKNTGLNSGTSPLSFMTYGGSFATQNNNYDQNSLPQPSSINLRNQNVSSKLLNTNYNSSSQNTSSMQQSPQHTVVLQSPSQSPRNNVTQSPRHTVTFQSPRHTVVPQSPLSRLPSYEESIVAQHLPSRCSPNQSPSDETKKRSESLLEELLSTPDSEPLFVSPSSPANDNFRIKLPFTQPGITPSTTVRATIVNANKMSVVSSTASSQSSSQVSNDATIGPGPGFAPVGSSQQSATLATPPTSSILGQPKRPVLNQGLAALSSIGPASSMLGSLTPNIQSTSNIQPSLQTPTSQLRSVSPAKTQISPNNSMASNSTDRCVPIQPRPMPPSSQAVVPQSNIPVCSKFKFKIVRPKNPYQPKTKPTSKPKSKPRKKRGPAKRKNKPMEIVDLLSSDEDMTPDGGEERTSEKSNSSDIKGTETETNVSEVTSDQAAALEQSGSSQISLFDETSRSANQDQPLSTLRNQSFDVQAPIEISQPPTEDTPDRLGGNNEERDEIEVIDLTWIDEMDDQELQREMDFVFIKKEEPRDENEEAQECNNLVVASPADSGISSPPVQSEDDTTVYTVNVQRLCICSAIARYNCVCGDAWYCGHECQVNDWGSHQRVCQTAHEPGDSHEELMLSDQDVDVPDKT